MAFAFGALCAAGLVLIAAQPMTIAEGTFAVAACLLVYLGLVWMNGGGEA